jgi:alpha-galactosidase
MRSLIALLIAAGCCGAQALAPQPPLGWNSWDSYGTTVTEREVRANADAMAKRLKDFGWRYIVVDVQWYEPNAKAHGYRENAQLTMDPYGRLLPADNRFPSAARGRGFKPLADYLHGKGLKFGIHIMRGIPRQAVRANLPVEGTKVRAAQIADTASVCKWNTDMYGVDTSRAGGREYYDSLVKLYASWGVDFIKADNMLDPYATGEIEALSAAIAKCGRPIVLSLSPGPAPLDKLDHLAKHAQMWRISNDVWDRWDDLKRQFTLLRQWAPLARPGAWPDADMLPIGHIGIRAEHGTDRMSLLTRDEQRMMMTLWSIARSPLMFGGDVPTMDDFTLSLLGNEEVLEANQRGAAARELFTRSSVVAWVSEAPGSKARFLALFHIGQLYEEKVRINWADLGLPMACKVRDLWAKKNLGADPGGRTFLVAPHSAGLYKISAVD